MTELMSHRDGLLTLGSLFDGSGGFPLAGVIHGIEPVWASEIEPFPIRVTKNRFPNMKHLGSVTDVNGAEVEPVDIITFGSPCQDLSVAGKQLGIHDGERSNLFFEAIRIIKEMRDATSNQFPRFAVWENVPGAFSSNKGEDFRAVLQAFAEICGGGFGVSVPMPPKGKWLHAGAVVGNGWSVAWRVYDAQFWGVPQRRKRIYLIADFRSERAGEILFKPESVSGHSETGGKEGERTSGDAEGGSGGSDSVISLNGNFVDRETRQNGVGWNDKKMYTLDATDKHSVCYAAPDVVYPINTMVATRGGKDDMQTCFGIGEMNDPQFTLSAAHEHGVIYPNVARSLCARYDSSPCVDRGQNVVCYGVDCRNGVIEKEKTHTIQAHNNGGFSVNCTPNVLFRNDGYGNFAEGAGTLKASGGDAGGGSECIVVERVYPVENHSADSRVTIRDDDKCQTLTSRM